eukprot:9088983-Alexandrium_andersonii.AAC.1
MEVAARGCEGGLRALRLGLRLGCCRTLWRHADGGPCLDVDPGEQCLQEPLPGPADPGPAGQERRRGVHRLRPRPRAGVRLAAGRPAPAPGQALGPLRQRLEELLPHLD